jgi:DNA-binding IclR family transcriptional regulator
MPEDQGDRLDLLAELGGEATARDVIEHEGGGRPQNTHARMQTMMRAGAVERHGKGTHSDPYRYRLTPVGELLRLNR